MPLRTLHVPGYGWINLDQVEAVEPITGVDAVNVRFASGRTQRVDNGTADALTQLCQAGDLMDPRTANLKGAGPLAGEAGRHGEAARVLDVGTAQVAAEEDDDDPPTDVDGARGANKKRPKLNHTFKKAR